MTTRSSVASSIPRASFAPPVPPARRTTGLGKPGDLDARARLVADVDPDDERRHRLEDAGHLEPAAVHAAQPGDPLDDLGHRLLVRLPVAGEEDVLVEL